MSESTAGHVTAARRLREAAGPWLAAFALGGAPIVLLGLHDGGYDDLAWKWTGLAFGAAAGLQLVLGFRRPHGLELVALGALAGIGALMALSALWGIAGTEPAREAQRCALYVAALAAYLTIVRTQTVRAALSGVLAGSVGLAAVALVDRTLSPPPLDPYQGGLLFEPVGYANALGILMAIGVVLATGLSLDEPRIAARAALAASACILLAALVLTSSRGSWLATAAGLTVLVLVRRRLSWKIVVPIVACVACVVLVAGSRAELGDRQAYWDVALADAAEHTLLGSGAGSFDDYWLEHRPIPATVRDAHSLYLETVAELGVVGLALLLCALGAPLVALMRTRDRRPAAIAAAAYLAFLVHAGIDWDWEMPVTTVAGLACGAALLAATRGEHPA